jgi:hypothetical protein
MQVKIPAVAVGLPCLLLRLKFERNLLRQPIPQLLPLPVASRQARD